MHTSNMVVRGREIEHVWTFIIDFQRNSILTYNHTFFEDGRHLPQFKLFAIVHMFNT